MAIYDFRCKMCERIEVDVVLPMTHTREDRPHCHGLPMETHITTAPMVHWKDYDVNYVPVSVKNAPPITSRKQEKEFMKKHDLVHADFDPPTREEELATVAETKRSIAAITPGTEAARSLDII